MAWCSLPSEPSMITVAVEILQAFATVENAEHLLHWTTVPLASATFELHLLQPE